MTVLPFECLLSLLPRFLADSALRSSCCSLGCLGCVLPCVLLQGAKPAHGGILPADKVTPAIAEARGVTIGQDCISPPRHTAFSGPVGLVNFVDQLRTLSGGKPVGIKMCVGHHAELAAVVRAMQESGSPPDFITVDGETPANDSDKRIASRIRSLYKQPSSKLLGQGIGPLCASQFSAIALT